MMRVSADTARRERLYGCGLTFHNADDPHDVLRPSNQPASYESMRLLMTSVRRRERPEKVLHHVGNVLAGIDTASALAYRKLVTPATRSIAVGLRAEQAPNPNSRVTLDDRRDRFNVPMAKVDWQLTSADLENVQRVRGICLDELNRRSRRDSGSFTADEDDRWLDGMYAAAHHMGTTRMHHDPRQGVVDEHCRVHGTSNVFVAGSSVFPTAGWAPPTLTIVALALRLSDHVKDVIA